MRLLSGLLAAQRFDSVLTGDASLSRRPMNRVAKPLREMGAVIETGPQGQPPLTIRGGQVLKGMNYTLPMASAQVKSSLLLAGLYAEGRTAVTEPAPTRDHTERMLRGFGCPVEVKGETVAVESGHGLVATRIEVPGDISSACFPLVAALIEQMKEGYRVQALLENIQRQFSAMTPEKLEEDLLATISILYTDGAIDRLRG